MLTSLPITEFELELRAKRAIAEWLGLWFDGTSHLLPGEDAAVAFPHAYIAFDQGPPPQPMGSSGYDCEIRVVMHQSLNRSYREEGGWQGFQHVRFDFWVRSAEHGKADAGASNAMVIRAAGLLFGLLENPDCHGDPDEDQPRGAELARLGITHLGPRAPSMVPMTTFACRIVTCAALLLYKTHKPDETGIEDETSDRVIDQLAPFFMDGACMAGRWMLGHYTWAGAARIVELTLQARYSTGVPTVLTLYVDGVATATTLTIPAGATDEEVTVTETADIDVEAMEEVRWQVTSSPELPEECPQVAAVTMRLARSVTLTADLTTLDSSVVYVRRSASYSGTLMLGDYAWARAMRVNAVSVRGVPCSGVATEYTLEVDGEPTTMTVSLPPGDEEAAGGAGPVIGAGLHARWRVSDSPEDLEGCATNVTLTMQLTEA